MFGVPDLRIEGDAKAFTILAQSKQVAVLAILCVARHGSVRRDRLLSLLWPDLDDARARNGLSKAIHNCRRVLGDTAIGGRFAEEIALDASAWTCDLWEFDDANSRGDRELALRIALGGELLDGLFVPESAAMEHWLDAQRARVRRIAVESASVLAEQEERDGNLERGAEHLRVAAGLSPLDERILRRRITLIDRLGDRAEALDAFAEFSLRLQRELEVEASPETLALVESMRRRVLPPDSLSVAAPTVPSAGPPDWSHAVRERIGAEISASKPLPTNAQSPLTASGGPPEVSVLTQPNRRQQLAGAAFLAGALLLVVTLAARERSRPEITAPERVIVTPFVNQTGDTTLAPIGELAADLLAAALSRVGVANVADVRTRMRKGLTVASPANGGDTDELAERAGRAGFNTIVTGRYYISNGALMVIAQLRSADATTPVVRFAEEQGVVTDPVTVLRKVEQRLLGAFATLHGARLAAASTATAVSPTYAAYLEYVGGLKPWIDGDARAAAAHFERTLRLDSSFVSVVPLLYEAWMISNRSASAESLLTRFAAQRNRLAPYDQAQLAYITGYHSGDRESMYQATQRMVCLAPHSPDAQWSRGFAAATTNRFAEALEAFKAAEVDRWWTRDKLFAAIHWQSISSHLLGRHSDELALVRAVRAQHPFVADACMYELRALAPRETRAEIERVLAGCIQGSGGTDAAWQANVRLMVAVELRSHERVREAEYFAASAVSSFRIGLQRDTASEELREGLATAQMVRGDWAAALPFFESRARARADNRPPRFAANTAIIAAHLGRTALSDEMLARLSASTPTLAFHLQRARVLVHRGRNADAVGALRTAIGKGLSATELFHADFGFEPLRRYAPFDALVRPRP